MVEIKQLNFGYRKNRLLFNNLDLSLPLGNIYGLFGKNGAGKTTLLKQITGLLYPTSGECKVFDIPSSQRSPKVLQDIIIIPEEFILPSISGFTFAKINGDFYPAYNKNELERLLNEFQVNGNERLNNLSYGQKKKFLISFGIATHVRWLILDEPTNGLDIPSKSQFRKILASAIDDNRSIIISTHQVRDLATLIDHVIILDEGKIKFFHSTIEISKRLSFGFLKDSDNEEIIYSEDSFGGKSAVFKNSGRETEVDLELLFNGVINRSIDINNVFKS